jgi:uncharacterized membrane protein YhaH (DUF805 family)
MIVWCLCPIASSLANQLGFYDGLSGSFDHFLKWGIPYLAGRIYFNSAKTLRDLCLGVVIGGLIYVPLCLYEIRMSPQLSNIFYDFFPHDWSQHKRYGGYRPIVFMQHGLMVALWMAVSASAAFWLWRSGKIRNVKGIPMPFIVAALVITCILCKSANGWFFLTIGCGSYYIFRFVRSRTVFLMIILLIPIYIGLRTTNTLSSDNMQSVAAIFVAPERVSSFGVRLYQEDVLTVEAFKRPLLGWGGWDRGRPKDSETDLAIIDHLDSLWILTFNKYGLVGLSSLFSSLVFGPWLVLRNKRAKDIQENLRVIFFVLSIVVVCFTIDCLVNSMVFPIYILISGALVRCYIELNKDSTKYQVESSKQLTY